MRCGPYPPAPAHEPNPPSLLSNGTGTWERKQGRSGSILPACSMKHTLGPTGLYRAENDSSRS